ncbi:mobilization protein [Agrobacterium rosae]|uniref:Mobilization protein n=1 Tax=Agrobacterium rosae TaxID=1972867 RepID=A0ABU4W577_9HYPH|nr:mobilization protein [Agrobacterium rosae]MDX8332947.1 mobilization protein [Agrobacterium rosae]
MRKPIAQRIKELEERKRALQSRLDRQERAQATRRKILLGSLVLERLAQDDDGNTGVQWDLRQWLAAQLPAFLVSDSDRALFADLLCAIAYAR